MLSLPALWLADGHEVAGHGIHNLVDGLQSDLQAAIRKAIGKAFDDKKVKVSTTSIDLPARGKTFFSGLLGGQKTLTAREFMRELFGAWVSEISADAAGLINMGPLFVDAGMLLLSASRHSGGLSSSSEYDSQTGFAEYPMDLVRVLFNIEMVRKMPIKDAGVYAQALHERLVAIMGGALPGPCFVDAEVRLVRAQHAARRSARDIARSGRRSAQVEAAFAVQPVSHRRDDLDRGGRTACSRRQPAAQAKAMPTSTSSSTRATSCRHR